MIGESVGGCPGRVCLCVDGRSRECGFCVSGVVIKGARDGAERSRPSAMMPCATRPVTAHDLASLAVIEAASYPPSVCEGAEIFAAHLAHYPAGAVAAVENDEIVGYCLFTPARSPIARSRSIRRGLLHSPLPTAAILFICTISPSLQNRVATALHEPCLRWS